MMEEVRNIRVRVCDIERLREDVRTAILKRDPSYNRLRMTDGFLFGVVIDHFLGVEPWR